MNYKTIILLLITILTSQNNMITERNKINSNHIIPIVNNTILDETINPDNYIIGPGDEFYFSMVSTNGINNGRLVVSPLGDIIIPIIGKIEVDKMILSEVFNLITKECNNKNVNIDITLSKIKDFKVLVVAPNNIPGGYYSVNSATRLSDVYNSIEIHLNDTLLSNQEPPQLSSRNIIINSNNSLKTYDLLAYNYSGDENNNPYIKHGDIIRLSYVNDYIDIYGAVKVPGKYEYKNDEKISDLIKVCGGYTSNANLDNIEVTRYINDFEKEIIYLTNKELDNFKIMPNDEFLIKPNIDYKRKSYVKISGEIKNPGIYTIDIYNKTTIKDIIIRSGGYSLRADTSKLVLNNETIDKLGDQELNRILALLPEDRSNLDESYVRARARSKRGGFSNSDFNINNSAIANYEVFDKDVIYIPTKYEFIEVIGAIRNPGRYPYIVDDRIKDYLELSGGITKNATKKYYIIEASTGDRIQIKAPFKYKLRSQDIIFVEEKNEYRVWDKLKDIIEVASQILTIIAITVSLTP